MKKSGRVFEIPQQKEERTHSNLRSVTAVTSNAAFQIWDIKADVFLQDDDKIIQSETFLSNDVRPIALRASRDLIVGIRCKQTRRTAFKGTLKRQDYCCNFWQKKQKTKFSKSLKNIPKFVT